MPYSISLVINQKSYALRDRQKLETAEFSAQLIQQHNQRYSLIISPRCPLVLGRVEATLELVYQAEDQVFCNGFQSWSESRWFKLSEGIPMLRRLATPLMGYYGDYHHTNIKRGPLSLHSWSWTCLQRADDPDKIRFWASLAEREGFTVFEHHGRSQQLCIRRDCEGHHINEPFVALDWMECTGSELYCFDQWFEALELAKSTAPVATGWTSWYHYYTNISAPILLDNLDACAQSPLKPSFFQIDDGWQTAVGDWGSIRSDAFPDGLSPLAHAIRGKGAIPGLWLAPFVAGKQAKIVRLHPEWLARDAKNKPVYAGYSPLWGGRFYALDSDHPGVKDYLSEVFHTVLEEWGFGLLKLDFLYAACIWPTRTATRGRRMYDAMQLMRQLAGSHYLLGCGVPLASAFGLLDYCRIGADIHLSWEHQLLSWLRNRERVSTVLALRTVLGRHALDGRAWRNDPDVFLLRHENIALSPIQKETVLRVNTLLGSLLFTSDPLGNYDVTQREYLEWMQAWKETPILAVRCLSADQYEIDTPKGCFGVNLSGQITMGIPAYSCVPIRPRQGA